MPGLQTRSSATTFPLEGIVEWARTGEIRIPAFQRGLRWDSRDVVTLFDSIYRGFPIGNLLLWERDAPDEEVVLGAWTVHAPAGQALYVVDGQQRITALAAALTEAGWADQRFAVGFDLVAREFTVRPRAGLAWVPAHVLYDGSALLAWFMERPDLVEHFDAASAVAKTLRDLRIPVYVVRGDDESVVQTIFDRTNNAGKKLTRSEVFAALHRSSGSGEETSTTAVAERIGALTGFGTLNGDLVTKILLARRGADVRREVRNEFERGAKGRDEFAAGEPAAAAFRGAEDVAVSAITFLEEVAQVPHLAFLPYDYLLVILARFLAHHPAPSPRHRRLLRRFCWRAAVIGPSLVPGNTTGVSRVLNRAVQPGSELRSVQGLMSLVARPRPDYTAPDPFRTNTAASKILLCALWQHGPRGLVDGRVVIADELRAALAGRSTAVDVVRPLLSGLDDHADESRAGNRLLLVPEVDRESDPLELLRGAEGVDEEVLRSHLLEPQDVMSLKAGETTAVLARRSERLAAVQEAFLDGMCEWEQEDTPDLEMLAAAAEDLDVTA